MDTDSRETTTHILPFRGETQMIRLPWFHGLLRFTLIAALASSPLAAQSPWAAVPKFPTSCYLNEDKFADEIGKAIEDMKEAVGKQRSINSELSGRVKGDAAAQTRNMMAYMQKDPAAAMKFMQEQQEWAAAMPGQAAAHNQRMEAFAAEMASLKTSRRVDEGTLSKPAQDIRDATSPRSKATAAELAALNAKANAVYLAYCAKWIQAGPMHVFLVKFRSYLTETSIPQSERGERIEKQQLENMGVDMKPYRSVATMQAVIKYMEYVNEVYARYPTGMIRTLDP